MTRILRSLLLASTFLFMQNAYANPDQDYRPNFDKHVYTLQDLINMNFDKHMLPVKQADSYALELGMIERDRIDCMVRDQGILNPRSCDRIDHRFNNLESAIAAESNRHQ